MFQNSSYKGIIHNIDLYHKINVVSCEFSQVKLATDVYSRQYPFQGEGEVVSVLYTIRVIR